MGSFGIQRGGPSSRYGPQLVATERWIHFIESSPLVPAHSHVAWPGGTAPTSERKKRSPRPRDLWALRDSNPRPSPCKGDALPAELSARSRGVSTCPAHDLPQGEGQTCPAASLAPVQALGPVGAVVLAVRTDQHLNSIGHRPRPRHLALVGIEGGTVAEEAARLIRRPHESQGYPLVGAYARLTRCVRRAYVRRVRQAGASGSKRSVSTA